MSSSTSTRGVAKDRDTDTEEEDDDDLDAWGRKVTTARCNGPNHGDNDGSKFLVGDRVKIDGLKSAPKFNKTFGTVIGWIPAVVENVAEDAAVIGKGAGETLAAGEG